MIDHLSNDIADVLPNSPTPGEVRIYVLMEDGTIAGQEVKNAVLAACNADETRPLTDHVLVEDPETVEYDIDATYYLNRGGPSAADVQSEVNAAVDAYVKWQAGKLGRDINPSELTRRMMVNGVKRVVIRSPVYTELRSGNVATDASGRVALADLTDTVPQVTDRDKMDSATTPISSTSRTVWRRLKLWQKLTRDSGEAS